MLGNADTSPDKIADLAERTLRKYDKHHEGSLDYEEFKEWIQSCPKIMEVFSGSFHEEIWSIEITHHESSNLTRRKDDLGGKFIEQTR
jgi:aminopeptidase-like protein